jgi:hypothetical protein
VENFRPSKYVGQHTTIHHQSTTNSPSKNHAQYVIFLKNPSKNTPPPRQKINLQKSTTNPSTIAA